MNSPRILVVKYNKNNMFESSPYDATTITVRLHSISLYAIVYFLEWLLYTRDDCFQAGWFA